MPRLRAPRLRLRPQGRELVHEGNPLLPERALGRRLRSGVRDGHHGLERLRLLQRVRELDDQVRPRRTITGPGAAAASSSTATASAATATTAADAAAVVAAALLSDVWREQLHGGGARHDSRRA